MSATLTGSFTNDGLVSLRDYFGRKIKKIYYCAGGTWVDAGTPAVSLSGTVITFKTKSDIYKKYPSGTTVTGVRLVDGAGTILVSATTALSITSMRTGLYNKVSINFGNA